MHNTHFNRLKIIALLLAGLSLNAMADDNVCSTASLINPNSIKGTGGTGDPAKGGTGGTGFPANGGAGGTGFPAAQGGSGAEVALQGIGGTGALLENGGIGGTSQLIAKGGIGGTSQPIDRGGMGGTGDSLALGQLLPINEDAELGMVGVVTGFASICVNGTEVHYDNATPVFDNGKKVGLNQLAVGKMVMLKASRVAGRLQAKGVGMFDAVAGPVGRVDAAQNQLKVLGQTVRVNKATIDQINAAGANVSVQVSGHRQQNGEIIATYVGLDNARPAGGAIGSTTGAVTSVNKDGFVVNGTQIRLADKIVLEKIKPGNEVRVNGQWSGGVLKAERVEAEPTRQLMSRSEKVVLEGYATVNAQRVVNIAGTQFRLSAQTINDRQLIDLNGRVVKIELQKGKSGDWFAERIEERKGRLFEHGRHGRHGGGRDDDDDEDNSGSGSGSSNSGSSNSGHGSSNSGSSNSGHGSSNSGSSNRGGGGHGGGSNSGASSGSSSRGGAVDRIRSPSGGDRDRVRSSGSGSGSGSGHGSRSGKN